MNKPLKSTTAREKVMLLVVLLAALGFLGWKFVFIPLQNRISGLQADKGLLQEEIDRLEEKIDRKTALEREWRELEKDRERLAILLPAPDQLPLVLGDLEELIGRYPNELKLLRSEGFVDREDYLGFSFRAGFEGKDSSLLSLFEALERFPHLLIASEAAWRREEERSSLEVIFALVFGDQGKKDKPEQEETGDVTGRPS